MSDGTLRMGQYESGRKNEAQDSLIRKYSIIKADATKIEEVYMTRNFNNKTKLDSGYNQKQSFILENKYKPNQPLTNLAKSDNQFEKVK